MTISKNKTILLLIVFTSIFILWRLSTALYTSEITRFNPTDSNGVQKLVGSSLYEDTDNVAWIQTAQEASATGQWRIHRIHWGGYPTGRDNHWATPQVAFLVAGGAVVQKITGQDRNTSIETATPIVYTLLFFALTCIGAALAVYAFGSKHGSILFLSLFFSMSIFWVTFHPLRYDHHGILLFTMAVYLGALLKILFARIGETNIPAAIVAGTSAGVGLWVSAINVLPIIIIPLLFLGAICIYARIKNLAPLYEYKTWRIFGWTIFSVSIVAYLFEYYPATPIRMEVNSPLYAVALLGGSYILSYIILAQNRQWVPNKRQIGIILFGVLGAALPIITILYFGQTVFTLMDPFWKRIPHIVTEGMPIGIDTIFSMGFLGIAILVIIICWAINNSLPNWRNLFPILCTFCTLALMAFSARRMFGSWVLVSIIAVVAVIAYTKDKLWEQPIRVVRVLLCLNIIIGIVAVCQQVEQEARTGRYATTTMSSAARIASEVIVDDAVKTKTDIIILAAPDISTFLSFYTGGKVNTGIYWEEMESWKKVLKFMFTEEETTAKEILAELKPTYIVLSKSSTMAYLVDGIKGLYPNPKAISERIIHGKIPWVTKLTNDDALLLVYKVNKSENAE